MTDLEDDKYRAPALDKGLDILELLAARESAMSQSEIAKALDRSAGEIFRMLDRLVRRGYVWRTGEDRYTLTLKLFELAHQTPPMKRLISEALPLMHAFAQKAGQACHLVAGDRNRLVVVAQVDSPGYWSVAIRVGTRISVPDTGSGQVFLAFASPVERERLLDGSPPEEAAAIEQRLAPIRVNGFARMPSRQIPAVTNLAVPVFGSQGTVIAALSCPFINRLDAADAPDADAALEMLKSAAASLSAPLISAG
ncbi:MAG TPA: IclR family transcriptional regulator [Rhizobiaceae bacterium]|nr:IclR family transcriptional regulator [Rhizobiaceae bacterium]